MSSENPNISPKPDAEDLTSTFERADNRWDIPNARRDWIIIITLVVVYLLWTGILFLFEPGIR